MASEKQITANRKNASAAGVRSAKGKDIVKWNALQHGILSQESVLDRGDVKESQSLHDELRTRFFAELQPVGIVEVTLVDQFFTAYWRLRRVVSAERAMIEEQCIGHIFRRVLQRGKDAGFQRQFAMCSFHERTRSSFGCSELLEEAKAVTAAIEETGLPLPDWAVDKLTKELGLAENFPKAEALFLHHNMVKDKEQLGIKEEGLKNLTKLALRTAKELEEFFKMGIDIWKEVERDTDRASAEAKLLLGGDDLQKVQRYEAHLHRLYIHALHELQRVQALRLGRPAPLTAALDVTVDTDNRFVS